VYTIYPYKTQGEWWFDDPTTGLEMEMLMPSVGELIRKLLGPDVDECVIRFSDEDFVGRKLHLHRPFVMANDWTWYLCAEHDHAVLLCPQLLKYFPRQPGTIYLEVTSTGETI
jgi:hypothetical protein